jgi:hypothetical protein
MQTIIDQVEACANGVLQVRMVKLGPNGERLGYHRTVLEPGTPPEAQFALVNAHLAAMGVGQVAASELERSVRVIEADRTVRRAEDGSDQVLALKALVAEVHTTEKVTEFQEAKAAALEAGLAQPGLKA